ncbi:MAG: DUF3343 domain-containing protein [Oscillospiraceae bacterium]|nr:DUF3343 domain-containing protein [Oscillospiraceae bacterium]
MHSHIIILCRSLTRSQRAAEALRRAGVFASVTKAPQLANPGGCAYGVKIGERNLAAARALLRREGLDCGTLLRLSPAGELEEVPE